MTTEKPLTRREIRERERAQFERLAASTSQREPAPLLDPHAEAPTLPPVPAPAPQFTPHPVAPARLELPPAAPLFDPRPVVLTPPPVIEALAPAAVLSPQLYIDDSFVGGPPPVPSQRITEMPVPDAAAPWPAWASKPTEMRPATASEVVPDTIAAAAPDLVEIAPPHELLAAEVPAALLPETPAVDAVASVAATTSAAPARAHRTRPTTPLAPRRAPQPVPQPAPQSAVRQAAASASRVRAVVPRSTTPSLRRRVMSKVFSTAALLFAGALLVGSSIPANAFMQNTLGETPEAFAETKAGQTMSVADGAAGLEGSARDGSYDVISPAELLAKKYGGNSDDYSAATTGSVRWPFPYSVRTSDGFGPRASPCGGCSTFHNGLDFLPGNGKPIYAVAAGTVSFHAMDGSLGNKVELEHVINGQPVQSVYAHMQLGSSPLQVGDKVEVGQFIGLVGATGIATAPHLHLEIHLAGVPVNPYAWLTANVN